MKSFLLTFILSGTLIACGTGNTKHKKNNSNSKATYANTITADALKEKLHIYASDEFEGRETGQAGEKKAVEYLKKHYQSIGVKSPLGNNNYFQNIPLQTMKVPTVTMSLNGKDYTMIDDFVSVTISKEGAFTTDEILYLGYGIDDKNYTNYTNVDVKDKVVLIKSGEPKDANDNYIITGTTSNSKWSNFRQEFASKRDAAKNKGAKAVLFYYPDVYAMAANRFGKSSDRMTLQGRENNMYYFLINSNIAKTLVSDIETNNTIKPVKANLKVDYKNHGNNFTSENVIAYIKGSEKPDEYIILSAHLDHEGIKNGEIYNGADDDGSGTVAIMQIAQAFKEAAKNGDGPKRSVVFLHVTAEEKGLLGSSYYTDFDPIFPLENTVANLNIDMIGRTDPKRKKGNRNYLYIIGSDKLSTDLHNISEDVNTDCCNIELDYTFNDDNDPNRFYYRSDHYNFAKNNIPVIFYFNGTHADYHKPTDTVEKIEYDLLENRTKLIFYTAWELANRTNRIVVDKTFK